VSADYACDFRIARERVLSVLLDLAWHSGKELDGAIGGNRYSARIRELRRLGYEIEDQPRLTGHGKVYRLVSALPRAPAGKRVKVYLDEVDARAIVGGEPTSAGREAVRNALASFEANRAKL